MDKKDRWKKCPFCGSGEAHEDKDGFRLNAVGDKIGWMLTCKCGIMSKIYNTRGELREAWETRSGKKGYMYPRVSVNQRSATKERYDAESGKPPF